MFLLLDVKKPGPEKAPRLLVYMMDTNYAVAGSTAFSSSAGVSSTAS